MATIIDDSAMTPKDNGVHSNQDSMDSSPRRETLDILRDMHDELSEESHAGTFSPGHAAGAATLSTLRTSPIQQSFFSPSNAPVITADQLQQIIGQLTTTIKSNHDSSHLSEEHLFSIAKSEFYISQGLSYKFDGDHERLAPWIKKFKALRANALWKDATYLSHGQVRYDILSEFTKVKESIIKQQALGRWTTDNQARSLKPNVPELFYPRILGKVVIASITDDFYTILQNYAGDELACDGPYLLWLILTHFHTSTVTYQDKLKQQVRSRTLADDHKDDIESYLLWLRHTIDILNTTTQADVHLDLLNPIFNQLLSAKSTRFRRIIEDWHLEYHSEEKHFTPTSLVMAADKKCKALRQSNQLYTTADSELIALEAHLRTTNTSGRHTSGTPTGGSTKRNENQRQAKPAWYHSPPTNPTQTHRFDDRLWHWCPKCGEHGKWVCTHTPDSQQDNFARKRKSDQQLNRQRPSPSPPPTTVHLAAPLTSADIAKLIAEQVSAQFQAHLAAFQVCTEQTAKSDATKDQAMDIGDW